MADRIIIPIAMLGGFVLGFLSVAVFGFKVTIQIPPFDPIRGEWLIFYFIILGFTREKRG